MSRDHSQNHYGPNASFDGHDSDLAAAGILIESLRQQLAAAIAACELKDESLEAAHNGLRWWMDAFPLHVTEADNEEMLKIVKALAIRPGTEALGKWLGEPVAIIGKHGHPKHISAIPSIEENRLYGPFEPLYAKPKGLK